MEYPDKHLNNMIRAWTIGLMLRDSPGIIKPLSFNLQENSMIIERWDCTLQDACNLITDNNRGIFMSHFIQGLDSMSKKNIYHANIFPSNVFLRLDPPTLMISGLEACSVTKDTSNTLDEPGIMMCLFFLKKSSQISQSINQKEYNNRNEEQSNNLFRHKYIPENIMKETYSQLRETVAIFVNDGEKRDEVLNNAFIMFSNAMNKYGNDTSQAKKCIMFSLYVSLNLSGITIECSILTNENIENLENMEWYKFFISPL